MFNDRERLQKDTWKKQCLNKIRGAINMELNDLLNKIYETLMVLTDK